MFTKVDTHTHNWYSGYSNLGILKFPESVRTPAMLVDDARRKGMGIVCITDHDAIKGAFEGQSYCKEKYDDIEVVVGEEVTSLDGEILGYWLNEFIPPGLPAEETVDRIHDQGGIAVAPHPFSFYVNCLKDKIFDLKLEGIELINGGHPDKFTNAKAREVFDADKDRWAAFSGSDSHSNYTSGFNWTEFEGEGSEEFRKAILEKRTIPCGEPAPPFSQTQWSMEVVMGGQKLMAKSLVGKLPTDQDNNLFKKINSITQQKKLGGILGGAMYLFPPVPFVAQGMSTVWLGRQAKKSSENKEVRFDSHSDRLKRIGKS